MSSSARMTPWQGWKYDPTRHLPPGLGGLTTSMHTPGPRLTLVARWVRRTPGAGSAKGSGAPDMEVGVHYGSSTNFPAVLDEIVAFEQAGVGVAWLGESYGF